MTAQDAEGFDYYIAGWNPERKNADPIPDVLFSHVLRKNKAAELARADHEARTFSPGILRLGRVRLFKRTKKLKTPPGLISCEDVNSP